MSALSAMRKLAQEVLIDFGYIRKRNNFWRSQEDCDVVIIVYRSRWSDQMLLDVGVIFSEVAKPPTDLPETTSLVVGHLHSRPPIPAGSAYAAAFNFEVDMDPDQRLALFREYVRDIVEPYVVKLTDVAFLRSDAGHELLRGMFVHGVVRDYLGLT